MMQCLRKVFGLVVFWALATHSFGQATIFFPPQTTNPTCNGSSNGSIVFSIQGDSTDFFLSWSGGNLPTNGNPTSGDGVIRQTGLSSGTYSIFILDLVSSFDTTIQVTLVNPQPITINAGNDISNCLGQPINLSATTNAAQNSTVVWSYNNVNGPHTLTGLSVTVPAVPSPLSITSFTTVSVLLTDPNGCTATDQVNVTVNPVPIGSANPTSQTICQGRAIINLSSSLSGGNFIWTVSQSGATGATSGNGSLISQVLRATGATNGTVTYNIRHVSSAGCIGQAFTSIVTIKPKPVASAVPDSSVICSGIQTNILLNSSLPNASFAWRAISTNLSGASNGTGNSITQTLNATTISNGKVVYRVAATVNDCPSDTIRVVVDVKPQPVLSVSPSDTINVCSGQAGTLIYGSNIPNSTFTWTASPNVVGGVSGTGATNTQNYTNSTAQTQRVTYTVRADFQGCSSAVKQSRVRVRPLPVVTALATSDTVCSGSAAVINLTSNIANSTFSWTSTATGAIGNAPSGTSNPISNVLTATGSGFGSVTYQIRGTAQTCQGAPISKTIVVRPLLNAIFEVTPSALTICSGNRAILKFSSALPGITYSWTVVQSGVTGAVIGTGDSVKQNLTLTGNNAGFVDYTITPKQGNCSGSSRTVRVNVTPPPTKPSFTTSGGTSPICQGQILTLTSNQLFGNQWFLNGAAIAAPTGTAQSLIVSTAGFYKVRFTNAQGCSSTSDSSQIVVTPLPTPPTISGNPGFCPGGNVILTSSSADGNQWQLNTSDISGATASTFQASVSGSYTVKLTEGNCSSISQPFEVTAFTNPPQPTISGNNFLCAGDSGRLASSSAAGYQWIRNSNLISGATADTLKIKQSGNYQVRISDTNGCQSTSNIFDVQGIEANPTPTISGVANFCPGDSTILNTDNVNPAWRNQWYRDGLLLAGDTLKTLVVKIAGVYTVTLKSPRGCISTSLPTTATLRPQPETPVISGLNLICPGGSNTLTSSASTGNVWFLDGSQILGANEITYAATVSGNYTVMVTNLQGCRATSNPFQIVETTEPQSTATLTDPSSCNSITGAISVSTTGGSGVYTYQWSPVSGGIIQGLQNQTNLHSGNYSVLVTDQNSGCSQLVAGMVLNDPANFTATAQVTNVTTCSGFNGKIELTISGSNGPFSFVWSPVSGNTSILNGIPEGYYSVQITDQTTGCSLIKDSIEVQSNIPPKPDITSSHGPEFCSGDSTILSTTAVGPYQWARIGTGALIGQTNSTLTIKTSGLYYVRTANPNFPNCFSRSDTLQITVNPLPANPVINSSSTTVCDGISVSLSTTSILGRQWLLNGNPIPGATSQILEVTTAGQYCLRVTDGNGCSRTGTNCKNVVINPIPPIAVISGVFGFCPGGGTTLSIAPFDTTLYEYTWMRNNQFIGNQDRSTLDVTIGGWYKVRTLNSATSCRIFSDSVFVDVFPSATAPTITGLATFCEGSSTQLTSSHGSTYQWLSGGSPIDGATDSVLNVSTAGVYSVTITNENGCLATSAEFAVSPIPSPTPSTISGNATFCAGSSQLLTASSNANYQWLFNGVPLLNQSNQTLTATLFGDYSVVVVSGGTGCTDTSEVFTTTQSASNFTVDTTITGTSCSGGQPQNNGAISVTIDNGSGNFSYNWTPVLSDAPTQTSLAAGTYAVTVKDLTTSCEVSLQNLVVAGTPVLAANPVITNDSRCDIDNGSILLNPTGGAGNYTFEWAESTITSNPRTDLGAGSYEVTITDVASTCSQVFSNLVVAGVDTFTANSDITQPTSCGGSGMIVANTNGGSGFFEFNWTGTGNGIVQGQAIQNSLTAGTYSVTITDTVSKCQKTISDLILINSGNINFDVVSTNPTTCGGTNGTAAALTGQSGFSYQWKSLQDGNIISSDSSVSGLASGNYRVTVSNMSCVDSSDFTLVAPTGFTVTAIVDSASTASSADGSIQLALPQGMTADSIRWSIVFPSTFFNILTLNNLLSVDTLYSTLYRVVVYSGDCSDTLVIFVPSRTQNVFEIHSPSTCGKNDGSILVPLCSEPPLSGDPPFDGTTYRWFTSDLSQISSPSCLLDSIFAGTYYVIPDGIGGDGLLHQIIVPDGPLPTFTTSIDSASCADTAGSITISSPNDITGYTVSWSKAGDANFSSSSNPLTGLSSGTYSAIFSNGNCKDTITVLLPKKTDCPAPLCSLSVSISKEDPGCQRNSGRAIAVVTGTTNPGFEWFKEGNSTALSTDDSLNNITEGSYYVIVTDGLCKDTATVTLLRDPGYTLIVSTDSATCADNDGTLRTEITIKQAPLDPPPFVVEQTYLWTKIGDASFSANTSVVPNVSSGTYQLIFHLTATAATLINCSDTILVTVNKPANCPTCSLSVSAIADSASCANNDGSITITTANASNSVAFAWTQIGNPSFTASTQNLNNLAAGIYQLITTDGNCKDTIQVVVLKPANCGSCSLDVVASSNPVNCAGGNDGTAMAFIVNGGVGPFSYQLNGSQTLNQSQFFAAFTNQPAGPFKVIVTDVATSCKDTVNQAIGTKVSLITNAFTTNPSCGFSDGQIRVVVSGGVEPFQVALGSNPPVLAVNGVAVFSGLLPGNYTVTVTDGTPCQATVSNITLSGTAPLTFAYGNVKPTSCFGSKDGAIQLTTLSGSSVGYNYFIPSVTPGFQPVVSGDSIKNLGAGTYSITIRAINGCEKDTSFTIPGTPELVASVGNLINSGCTDSTGSAKINSVSGGHGAPFAYNLLLNSNLYASGTQLPSDSILRNLTSGNYQLVVSDVVGCNDTVSFSIGINTIAPLISVAASKTTICAGDTVTLTATNSAFIDLPSYSWYMNGQLLNVSGGQIQLDTIENGDSIRVKIKGSSACLDPDSAWSNVIHFNVLPANLQALAAINPIKAQACIGQSAKLQALNLNNLPNVGYRWIVNGIVSATDTNEFITIFPGLPVNTVQAIVFTRSTSSCIGKARDTSAVQLVTQVQGFAARDSLFQISPLAGQNICPTTPVLFSVKSNIRSSVPTIIQWFRNDTLVVAGTDTFFTFTGLPNGAIIKAVASFDTSLTCISTNSGFGFDSTLSKQITVLPAGDVRCQPCALNATANVSNINCAGGNTGSIIVNATGGTGNYKYSLLPSGPTNQSLQFFFGLAPGAYSILVRDTVTGCTKTISGLNIIIQNNYNAIVATVNPTPCVAQPDGKLEFISVTDGSGDLNKYKFRVNSAAPYTTNRLFTGLAAGTYTMEAIDTITGCLIQISRTLVAPSGLEAFATVTSRPTCYGQFNGAIRLDSVKGGFGFYQYSLSGDSGTFAATQLAQPLPMGFGVGSYSIFIRDVQSGCIDTVNLNVTQPDSIKLAATTLIQSACSVPTGQMKIKEYSGGSGLLKLEIKYPGSTIFLPLTVPTDSVLTALTGGDYVIVATDTNNCQKQILVNIPINGPHAEQIVVVKPCIGDTNGVIKLVRTGGGVGPYTYTLNDDQGNVLRTQADTVFAQLKPGLYGIKITDASTPSCEVSYSRNLQAPAKVQLNLAGSLSSTCENFDGVMKFTITGGQPGFVYSFDSLAGGFTSYKAVIGDTLTLKGLSTRVPGNPYTLRLLDAGPNGGCAYDTTFNVPGNSPLRFKFTTQNVKCFGENSGSIRIDSLNGTGPVMVRVTDKVSGIVVKEDSIVGGVFFNNQFVVGGLPAGDFNFTVVQYGACNSSRISEVILTQPTQIQIQARQYKPTAQGFSMGSVLLDTVRGSVSPYWVSFNEGTVFNYKPDTLFDHLSVGIYTIRVTDSIGCVVSKEIEVLEDIQFFVPTLFTPNGDGLNDLFEIRNLPAGSSLKVNDRWGKEVYKSGDYQNDWEAKDEDDGTYFWTLDVPGQDSRTGWVQIIR